MWFLWTIWNVDLQSFSATPVNWHVYLRRVQAVILPPRLHKCWHTHLYSPWSCLLKHLAIFLHLFKNIHDLLHFLADSSPFLITAFWLKVVLAIPISFVFSMEPSVKEIICRFLTLWLIWLLQHRLDIEFYHTICVSLDIDFFLRANMPWFILCQNS